MSDSTLVLCHYHDDYASNNLYLTNQIEEMEAKSMTSLYSDLRSLSRGQRQRRRKRQPIPNPIFRTKHCHHNCLCYLQRAIPSRQRRWRVTRADCTDEAYWDKECAELEHREGIECTDLVTLFYNHGHNTEVIERLHPKLLDCSEEEKVDNDANDWVQVSHDMNADVEVEAVTTRGWTLYLYPPPSSPTSDSMSLDNRTSKPDHISTSLDYAWDVTTFAYHRNLTGLWELGYASRYTPFDPCESSQNPSSNALDHYGCKQSPLALDCGCCSSNRGCFPCSCASFPSWWRSPEEKWRGSIADLMSEQMYDDLWCAQALHERMQEFDRTSRNAGHRDDSRGRREKRETEGSGEWTFVRALRVHTEPEEWDVVSALSSTGSWRIVDVT